MKLHYYPDTDSLYIELQPGPSVEAREISAGLVVDLERAAAWWVWISTTPPSTWT